MRSADPDRSVEFYGELFDWKPVHLGAEGDLDFHLRSAAVAGLAPTVAPHQPSAWLTYLSSADLAGTVASATQAGGRTLQPPTDRAGRGVAALLADPQGAAFGLWQRGTFAGAQVASEPGASCWNELACRDVAQATGFYGAVFGWITRASIYSDNEGYREWLHDSREVAGLIEMGALYPPEVPAHWRTTFEVDDCEQTVSRCVEHGGQVAFGPFDAGPGVYAQLVDPLGAAFGVIALIPEFRSPLA
ncbi:VOC family protein [Solwaraspora sp. WMMD406]|uniref:VOC family protein n=1 Tax=Solwaraspora sp. WMMD406 TaxID=3016095 RepID=UPI002417E7CA|nr:VOC family protein [Solwaraspora sp. WMMD406]MDG4766618.1 VOC family protein [Solwaraspora sp. WMMD406]